MVMHERTWVQDRGGSMEISRWLFNPFYYVAGAKALGLGLLVLILTGMFGFWGKIRFDGLLDFHMGLPPLPIWGNIAETLFSWLLLSILLFFAGKMISKSRPRLIDVFGTQALARLPYLLVSLTALMPGANRFTNELLTGRASWDQFSADMAVFLFVAIFGLVMMVWMIALMYRAFAVSCNVSGKVAILVFIIALAVGEIISKVIILRMLPVSMVA
jgi:hypothetical protein